LRTCQDNHGGLVNLRIDSIYGCRLIAAIPGRSLPFFTTLTLTINTDHIFQHRHAIVKPFVNEWIQHGFQPKCNRQSIALEKLLVELLLGFLLRRTLLVLGRSTIGNP
jgi:hypothetical protein